MGTHSGPNRARLGGGRGVGRPFEGSLDLDRNASGLRPRGFKDSKTSRRAQAVPGLHVAISSLLAMLTPRPRGGLSCQAPSDLFAKPLIQQRGEGNATTACSQSHFDFLA